MRTEFRVVDASIGLRRCIAQMRVLAQSGLHDFGKRVTDSLDLCEHSQHSVLHLLHCVGDSIWPMHLHRTRRLVHRKLIPLQVELFVGKGEVLDHRVLALGADVIIPRVIPCAHVQSWNVLTGLERRIGLGPHPRSVKMARVRSCLARIVEMRNTVP